jgi:polyribonucleotide nucleotidyltransferase
VTPITKEIQFGDKTVKLETGEIARQSSGAVMASMGDTVVLVTAVAKETADPGRDFFPLTVNYQEKTYSAGKIPGGFFKREGRPSEKETLTCRLIDRPIRPLFPKEFINEVQIIATVVSIDPEIDPDIPALIGASAALSLTGCPFKGPIAAARVGYKDGNYILNPTKSELLDSDLDLVVAGTMNAVLMVESEAKTLHEDVMLGAVVYGHDQLKTVITGIEEFVAAAGVTSWDWQAPEKDTALAAKVAELGESQVNEAYQISEKQTRYSKLSEIRSGIVEKLSEGEDPQWAKDDVSDAISALEKKIVRGRVLSLALLKRKLYVAVCCRVNYASMVVIPGL